jgi:hypothetical protein
MTRYRVRHMPVLRNGKLAGIVSSLMAFDSYRQVTRFGALQDFVHIGSGARLKTGCVSTGVDP